MIGEDFRASVSPHTAQRRLDFWLSIDAALWAQRYRAELDGSAVSRSSVEGAFENVINANIRLARAQLEARREVSA